MDPVPDSELHQAVRANRLDWIDAIVDSGPFPILEKSGKNPFHLAATLGLPVLVKYFLSRNRGLVRSISFKGRTALHYAVRHNHIETVEVLIQEGSTMIPDRFNLTPIHSAIQLGNQSMFRLLARYYPEESSKFSILQFAIQLNQGTITQEIFRLNPQLVLKSDSAGYSPLHLMAKDGFGPELGTILESAREMLFPPGWVNSFRSWIGQDLFQIQVLDRPTLRVSCRSGGGYTPMYLAAMHGRKDIISILIQAGSRGINIPAENGRRPLHAAVVGVDGVSIDPIPVIQQLLQAGAEIDAFDDRYRTPLVFAIMKNNIAAVETLVGAGSKGLNPGGSGIEYLLRGDMFLELMLFPFKTVYPKPEIDRREMLMTLIRLGADINPAGDWSLLSQALNMNPPKYATILRAAGAKLYPRELNFRLKPLPEETILGIRYQIYFSVSLFHRLMMMMIG